MTLMHDLRSRTPLARLLQDERKRLGLKQSELAERLGVPQSFVSKYENEERGLEFIEVQAICLALNVPLTEFVGRVQEAMRASDAADP